MLYDTKSILSVNLISIVDYKATVDNIERMTLAEYIQQFPRPQRFAIRVSLATALGVSEVYVRSMCNGHKLIPGKHAIPIEKFTCSAVTRHESCPTLYPLEGR
jgi:DNA-binding transcriptional regulator YdaS (Cro superfamily)